jgi:hypothetical protein
VNRLVVVDYQDAPIVSVVRVSHIVAFGSKTEILSDHSAIPDGTQWHKCNQLLRIGEGLGANAISGGKM